MMTKTFSGPGNILTTHLLLPRRKEGDVPLVCQEIYFKPKNSNATPPSLMDDTDLVMDDGNADVVPTPTPKFKSSIRGGGLLISVMATLTRPKEGVSEKKSKLNEIVTLQLHSFSLSTWMMVLSLRYVSFPFFFRVLDWVWICP
jgi:hypothetical protein